MDILEISALLRRHLVAVVVVCVLAAGTAYGLEHADPGYQDSGTVAITAPKAAQDMFAYGFSLLVLEDLMNSYIASSSAKQQIRAAGGSGNYNVTMVNLSNQEHPYYQNPYLNITASAPSAEVTQRTFSAVLNVLAKQLAHLQAVQGVAPLHQITVTVASQQAAPILQRGSRMRSLAAIAMLTVIAAIMSAYALDRRNQRRSRRRQTSTTAS